MTSGSSVEIARPMASDLSAIPGPLVAVIPNKPEKYVRDWAGHGDHMGGVPCLPEMARIFRQEDMASAASSTSLNPLTNLPAPETCSEKTTLIGRSCGHH